jgi:signal peptidase I
MTPTIKSGDMVICLNYIFSQPKRGDIISFSADKINTHPIKRIIGLPGETIKIHGSAVYINGEELEEPYIDGQLYTDYGPVTIPNKCLFVLGDNRNNSTDSRSIGMISYDDIRGKIILNLRPIVKGTRDE